MINWIVWIELFIWITYYGWYIKKQTKPYQSDNDSLEYYLRDSLVDIFFLNFHDGLFVLFVM